MVLQAQARCGGVCGEKEYGEAAHSRRGIHCVHAGGAARLLCQLWVRECAQRRLATVALSGLLSLTSPRSLGPAWCHARVGSGANGPGECDDDGDDGGCGR